MARLGEKHVQTRLVSTVRERRHALAISEKPDVAVNATPMRFALGILSDES